MILKNKNAVIFGAGGSLGGAVARSLAGAGAKVFLTGRSLTSVNKVADDIRAHGGTVKVGLVDALNESEVRAYLDKVIAEVKTIEITFCAIDFQVVQNMNLVDMKVEDFVRPVKIAMQSQFVTSTIAASIMMKLGSGVILS